MIIDNYTLPIKKQGDRLKTEHTVLFSSRVSDLRLKHHILTDFSYSYTGHTDELHFLSSVATVHKNCFSAFDSQSDLTYIYNTFLCRTKLITSDKACKTIFKRKYNKKSLCGARTCVPTP